MLNYIWLGLMVCALLLGGFSGRIDAVSAASVESAKGAVTLALGLLGVVTLWLGLMRLVEKAGLVHRLGLALKPIMHWLFPEVPVDHPAMGAIILNVAANILGLNNAATPARPARDAGTAKPEPPARRRHQRDVHAPGDQHQLDHAHPGDGHRHALHRARPRSDPRHRHVAGRHGHCPRLRHRCLQAAGTKPILPAAAA